MRYIAAAAVLLLGGLSLAQWGSQGCGTAGLQLQAQTPPSVEWRRVPGEMHTSYLYRDGVQIGGYNHAENYWIPYDAKTDTWGGRVPCMPTDVPGIVDTGRGGVRNFGVEWPRIQGSNIMYEGRCITQEYAKLLIEKEIPNHAKKFHLVVIGPDDQRKLVTDQLTQLEPELQARILTRSVRPGDFSLKDTTTGNAVYKQDGPVNVYFQAPNGKPLHRQADSSNVVEAIRKGIRQYDANKDPDLRRPLSPNSPMNGFLPAAAVIGGIVLLVFIAKGK